MRQVYDTPDGLEVAVHVGAGDIDVDVRDTATTTVEIDGYDADEPPTVRCEPAPGGGHRLTIEYRSKKKWFAIGRGVGIHLVVPPGTTIEGSTGAADLDANGTLEALSFKTGSGDLRFDDVSGDVDLTCASGDVEGRSVGGHLGFKGASGDIDVGSVGAGATVRSASGDIRIGRLDGSTIITVGSGDVTLHHVGPGSVNVRAISGDVAVAVQSGLGVWLDVSSTSGGVHSALESDGDGAGGDVAPDLELTLNTVAGDITIDRAGGR
jgi:Putative adhesin